MNLDRKHYDEVELSSDVFTPVGFGGVADAHVVVLKSPGRKVTARLTSADGSQQLIPVEEFAFLMSISTPFTAIDLQRETGVTTTVMIFLGQRAA